MSLIIKAVGSDLSWLLDQVWVDNRIHPDEYATLKDKAEKVFNDLKSEQGASQLSAFKAKVNEVLDIGIEVSLNARPESSMSESTEDQWWAMASDRVLRTSTTPWEPEEDVAAEEQRSKDCQELVRVIEYQLAYLIVSFDLILQRLRPA